MITFPNAKINIGLRVVKKLGNGYHEIDSILYPIELQDVLEVQKCDYPDLNQLPFYSDNEDKFLIDNSFQGSENQVHFTQDNAIKYLKPEDNLCMKAYDAIKKYLPDNHVPVYMNIKKIIPDGAGLGGGSSDAAFVLKMFNEHFELNLTDQKLEQIAGTIGSDCPFFIKNQPSRVQGQGELIAPIPLSLKNKYLIIVKPDINISTAWAYNNVKPSGEYLPVESILSEPVKNWTEIVVNDFEQVVFEFYPEIQRIRDVLLQQNAVFAGLSGSGSSVFGIFDNEKNLQSEFLNCYYVGYYLNN